MTDSLYYPNERVQMADIAAGDEYQRQLLAAQNVLQRNGVTAEQALAAYRQSPNQSPGLLSASLLSGLATTGNAGALQAVADRDPGQDEFQWYDPRDWVSEGVEKFTGAIDSVAGSFLYEQVLKPLVRGAFVLLEGTSQELVQRPLSALYAGMGASDQDVSVREAYNQYGTSALFQGLGNVIGTPTGDEIDPETGEGRGFDFGTGFVTGGDAYEQQQEARRLTVQDEQANMARLFLDPALSRVGLSPGDGIYDWTVGLSQFAVEVLTDPSILVSAGTGSIAKVAGRGASAVARVGTSAEKAAQFGDDIARALTVSGTSQRRRAAQMFGGRARRPGEITPGATGRVTASGRDITAAEVIGGRQQQVRQIIGVDDAADVREVSARLRTVLDEGGEDAERVTSLLRENIGLIEGSNGRSVIFDKVSSFTNNDGLLNAIAAADTRTIARSFKSTRESSVPIEFIGALGRAKNADEVAAVLSEAIGTGYIKNRNFYGGFGSMVRKRLDSGGYIARKIDKFSGVASRGVVHAGDMDVATAKIDTLMRQGGLDADFQNEILDELSLIRQDDNSALFETTIKVYNRLGRDLTERTGNDQWLADMASVYNRELENLRAYNVDAAGNTKEGVVGQRWIKYEAADGTAEQVLAPTPHLLNELNQMAIPLPDIDDIRRAATDSDLMRSVYESAGWEWGTRSLQKLTRSVFKPLVLLRPAYIARTQIDDQLRMWASGVDSAVTSPTHLVQMAQRAPEVLLRMADADPNVARYARKVLNHSLLDVGGGRGLAKTARERVYTIVKKPFVDPDATRGARRTEFADYVRAWRTELGQLADDEIAAFMARNGMSVEETAAAILGKRIGNPEVVARIEEEEKVFRLIEDAFGDLDGAAIRSSDTYQEALGSYNDERIQNGYERMMRRRYGDDWETRQGEIRVDPRTGMREGQPALVTGAPDWSSLTFGQIVDEVGEEFADQFFEGSITAEDLSVVWSSKNPAGSGGDDLIPLREYLETNADDLREQALQSVMGRKKAFPESGDSFVNRTEFRHVVQTILRKDGMEASKAADYAERLADEWAAWTDAEQAAYFNPAKGLEEHQNTLREQGLLLGLTRNTGAAGRTLHRGQKMPVALFNDLVDKGVITEGGEWNISRMSSATTSPDKASFFARQQLRDDEIQIMVRDKDGTVRGMNLGWSSQEDEWLMPEQVATITGMRRITDPDEIRALSNEDIRLSANNPNGVVILDIEGTANKPLAQQVIEEGPQPFMHDMNIRGFDGSPQSLAHKAWDDLTPGERDQYETLAGEIRKVLSGTAEEQAFQQYYSTLRHVVDNAPEISDEIYLPASRINPDDTKSTTMDAGTDTYEVGNPLRTDNNTPWADELTGRDRAIRERITRGAIDPSMIDEDVVIRLPRGSQALRVSTEGEYLVPPSRLRVVKKRQVGDKTIIDVEITGQPMRNKPIKGQAARDAPLSDAVRRVANSSNPDIRRLLEDEEALRAYLISVRDRIQTKTGNNPDIINQLTGSDGNLLMDDAAFEDFLHERIESAPQALKAQRFPEGDMDRERGVLETLTAWGFDTIVSNPAAKLSRYPAWVQMMTRDIAELMPQMADNTLREDMIRWMADEMGATDQQLQILRRAADEAKDSAGGLITSREKATELALAHASEGVEDLLFDVANKSAFQDAFDVIFPFVDAWREGIEVWTRMIRRDPSIFMKGMASMRGAEEAGAIYTNDRGERMFAMPASGTLGNFVQRMNADQNMLQAAAGAAFDTVRGELDEDQVGPIQTQMGMRLSGVNLMLNSIGPGFGPVVQWPAGAFLPDTPQYAGLQELINPYGDPFDSAGDIVNPKAYVQSLSPSWFNKVVNAWTGGEVDPVQWNSMLHDSLRALEMSGDYDPTSMEDRERLTEDAERTARWLLMTRGLVHGFGPTSPSINWRVKTDGVDEEFQPFRDWDLSADPDGVWHEINTLASAYYEIYDQVGDSDLATQQFLEAYGVTPAYLRTPKSRIISNLPATKDAAYWADENRGAMLKYPVVAGYFAPPDEGNENFDYRIWLDQFASGDRETLDAGQQIALSNRTQAQQIYYSTKDRIDALDLPSGQKRSIMSVMKGRLEEQFPGWQIGVPGLTSIPTDQKISQLEMAAFDPELESSPLTAPLQQYFTTRTLLLERLREQEGASNATLGRESAEPYRQALARIGTLLSTRSPEFRGVWDLLRREVD